MKTAHRILLPLALAAALVGCDDAKLKAEQAAAQAKAAAEDAMAKAGPTADSLKAKASEALKEAGAVSSDTLDKTKELLGDAATKAKDAGSAAMKFASAKFGVPDIDTVLEGFDGLIADAGTAMKEGVNGEKIQGLKAKWDTLYASAQQKMANLAPEQKEKLTTILSNIKAHWDTLMARANGTAPTQ